MDEPATPARAITVWLDGGEREVALFHRETLRCGQYFSGPAVVAQEDTTICIPAGFEAQVDAFLNLHLILREGA